MTGYGPVTPDDVDHDEDGPQGAEWLGHRDNCSLQWSNRCDCNDPPCSCPPAQIWGSGGDLIDQPEAPDCLAHGEPQ